MRGMLITNKDSFARRAHKSLRFSEIWQRKQRESPEDYFRVLKDLHYAEHRYDSRSAPMSTFLMKLGPAIEVLQEMALDKRKEHSADRQWAVSLLKHLTGPKGFVDLVLFALDADFAVATHKLVRVQDKTQADIALTQSEVQSTLDTCKALFDDGHVFNEAPNGTYTNALLQGLKGVQRIVLLGGGEEAIFGWPEAISSDLLKEPVRHARRLYKLSKSFFQLNFPDYDWRNKFGAFHMGSKHTVALPVRLEWVEALAKHENLDPVQTRFQFENALPHVQRLFARSHDNRTAWADYLDICRKPGRSHFRPTALCIASLALTYIGIMDSTSDVERTFSRMEMLTSKRSKDHHKESTLQSLLTVALHSPADLESLLTMAPSPTLTSIPNDACQAPHSEATTRWVSVVWKPTKFISDCQKKYAEFFGARRFKSRSLNPVPLTKKAQQLLTVRARWTTRQQPGAHKAQARKSRRQRVGEWEEAAKTAVAAMQVEVQASQNAVAEPADSLVRKTLLSVDPTIQPDDIKHALAHVERRIISDRKAHEAAKADGGLAAPPGPVRLDKLLPKAPVADKKDHEAAKADGSLAAPPGPVRLDELLPKTPVATTSGKKPEKRTAPEHSASPCPKKRLAEATVMAGCQPGSSEVVHKKNTALAVSLGKWLPTKPLQVYVTAAAQRKHQKCFQVLLRSPDKVQLLKSATEVAASPSAHVVMTGKRDSEWKIGLEAVSSKEQMRTMSGFFEFCCSEAQSAH